MDVIYLLYKENAVKIPFFGNDKWIFRQLSRLNGIWDNDWGGFVFNKDINIEKIKCLFNVVCVISDKIPHTQIYGFINNQKNTEKSSIYSPIKKDERKCHQTEYQKQHIFSNREKKLPECFSEQLLNKLEFELRSRKFSVKTQKAYIYFNRLICRTLQKIPEEIYPDDVTEFLAILENERGYSASSLNLAISAIKFFFRHILKDNRINEQKRPDNNKTLPVVLSSEEIIKILKTEKNPKHRLLLMLAYSSGLRVSEVVSLKKEHIDLSRFVILVKQGKGRKDRYTMLSEKAALFIQEYYEDFKIEKWIFPGQSGVKHLTIRSAQRVFEKAVRNAGIIKNISIHGLRHTFATHLLESGTDIRYIQDLLGHSSIRTTERYTQVARRNILKIKSPLDNIM